MLGFSPLASAPLANTGAVADAAFGLDDIVTGAPTVAASTITQIISLTADSITAGVPTVGAPSVTQSQALTASDIVAGVPVVGLARFKWQVETVPAAVWTEQEAA